MEEYKKWLTIRRIITGNTKKKVSMNDLFSLAEKCTHPMALWFCNLFLEKERPAHDYELAKFLKSINDDDNAILFNCPNTNVLIHIASKGNQYAQSLLAVRMLVNNRFDDCLKWGKMAENDPIGLFLVGKVLLGKNDMNCIEYFEKASDLDDYNATVELYHIFRSKDPLKATKYCLRMVHLGDTIRRMVHFVQHYVKNDIEIMFTIGENLKYHIPWDSRLDNCLCVYKTTITKVKLAIHTWSIFATRYLRNYINKDIRCKIAKILWDLRISWVEGQEEQQMKNERRQIRKVIGYSKRYYRK